MDLVFSWDWVLELRKHGRKPDAAGRRERSGNGAGGHENWPAPLGFAVCLDRKPVNQRRNRVRRSD